MSLKLVSWNIWGGKHLDKVLAQLQEIDADIIGLQEVKEQPDLNQAHFLAKKLNMHYHYCSVFTDDRHDETYRLGNAIFSKLPLSEDQCVELSGMRYYEKNSLTEPRCACVAEIKYKGIEIKLISTHLGYARDNERTDIRVRQLEQLKQVLREEKLLLVGDFNSFPNSFVLNELSQILTNTDSDLTQTSTTDFYTHGQPRYRIDYIFASHDLKFKNFQILHTEASDHKPLVVEIEV